ncbi:MAG: hypothetical protein FWH15_09775 [Betaproteobacteria bacterium]|nr:hypothetical protein [Betaproteobacteria bacterium]
MRNQTSDAACAGFIRAVWRGLIHVHESMINDTVRELVEDVFTKIQQSSRGFASPGPMGIHGRAMRSSFAEKRQISCAPDRMSFKAIYDAMNFTQLIVNSAGSGTGVADWIHALHLDPTWSFSVKNVASEYREKMTKSLQNKSLTALASLEGYVGKSIGDICGNKYISAQSHCAHFVGHALGIQLGLICGDMAYKTRKTGASIRVDEIYNQLASRGKWEDKPASGDGLLIFVISATEVRNGVMTDFSQKHVGIHFGGKVFHYSNGQKKVVVESSVDVFHNTFKRTYSRSKDVSLFFGVPPTPKTHEVRTLL